MVTIEEAQANKELMDIFISENMGLVRMALKQLHISPTDDHLQEGAIGLIKAARRFDTSFGVAFSTYAVPKIAGQIRQFIRDYDSSNNISGMRVAREVKGIYFKNIKSHCCNDYEFCRENNLTIEQLKESRIAMSPFKSLDEDAHKGDSDNAPISLHSVVPGSANVEEDAISKVYIDEIKSIVHETFGEKETRLIDLYLQGLNQGEIGKAINISQVQVSRTLRKIGKVLSQG
jgi:RNA polymerase sporulation-specific sigma factor